MDRRVKPGNDARACGIVLAARLRPSDFGRCAIGNQSEGRAGRREVQQIRGNSGKNPQVRLLSSVPRAMFEAFLRMAPGG